MSLKARECSCAGKVLHTLGAACAISCVIGVEPPAGGRRNAIAVGECVASLSG
jgi:hypothetical protein